MKDVIRETLAFKELTPEEKTKRGILGRLYGPIADIINPTRNGRAYSEELWEKVFNDNEIVKELLSKGGIPGELDHPADRQEVSSERIAIMMPEAPKKDKSGKLIAYFDILDTPLGRIAYQLAKYGFELGISSRAQGDVMDNDEVDPNTYDFTCFDLVLIPSVKDARLRMTESLNINELNFKQALNESLETANADERKVMEETLEHLNIELDETLKTVDEEEPKLQNESIPEEDGDKLSAEGTAEQTDDKKSEEAKNDGSEELVKSLQEALTYKSTLEAEKKSLQEKLALSNIKVNSLNEEVARYKAATARLSIIAHDVKGLRDKVSTLEESLKIKDQTIKQLNESKEKHSSTTQSLNEAISTKDAQIASLNEDISKQKKEFESQIRQLNEENASTTKEVKKLKESLNQTIKTKNGYKKLANDAVNSYIDYRATMLGITPTEIKNKLDESYTIEDVNKVCEDLQNYELNINKLPFSLGRKAKIKVTESKNDILNPSNPDDEVDTSFLDYLAK